MTTTLDPTPKSEEEQEPPAGPAGAPLQGPLAGVLRSILAQATAAARNPPPPRPAPAGPCPACAGSGYSLSPVGAHAVATPCSCERRCGRCGGRGFTIRKHAKGYEFHDACECQTLPQRLAAYNAAQIPARFCGKSFQDFDLQKAQGVDLVLAKQTLQDFAATAQPGVAKRGVVLASPPGRGKTHLLAAALAHLTLGRGIPCRYVEMSLLFADHKAAISDERARAGLDKLDRLASVPILAIDELGKGRASQFELELLDELVSRRYNTGKLTLFATNYPRERPAARGGGNVDPTRPEPFGDSLEDRVGPRVFSRLVEIANILQIQQAADFRQRGR